MDNSTCSEKPRESSKISEMLPPVVLSPELHTLIGTVKELQIITTYKEVLDGLGQYIANKKLYDPEKNKVCCKGDDLGSVFGTEEFAVSELNTLLPKLAVPVNKMPNDSAGTSAIQCDNPLKRKMEGGFELDHRKIPAVNGVNSASPIYLHVPSSPSYCDVSDSVESIQGYETALVKDTSDEFLSAENGEERILAIEETYNIEYDVESDSSNSTISGNSSDSESEDILNIETAIFQFISKVFYKPKSDSDIEFFADASSDDDEQSDAEITQSDLWSCPKCNIKNKPAVRYCLKCFQQRRNWLPDKPSNMRRRRRKSHSNYRYAKDKLSEEASFAKCDQDSQRSNSSSGVSCEIKENSSDPTSNMQSVVPCDVELVDYPSMESLDSLCVVDSTTSPCVGEVPSPVPITSPESLGLFSMGLSGSHCMDSTDLSLMKAAVSSSMKSSTSSSMKSSFSSYRESLCPSSMGSSCPSGMESFGPSSMESSGPSSMEYTDSSCAEKGGMGKLCMLCCSDPVNASIIHGKFAHQMSCYKCARRLQREKKGCPVCRRTIDRVVIQVNM